MRARGTVALALGAALAAGRASALETDQFYAWTHPLTDVSVALNDQVNAEIDAALARLNARTKGGDCSCREARSAIRRHLHYPLITQIELWIASAPQVSRYPMTAAEEERYRRSYLYHGKSPLDPVRWMPPSPTIEVDGVRLGTDKLGHFFSVGAWIEGPYRRARRKGASPDDAVEQALISGLRSEQRFLGGSSSGVLSMADLEANYQGLLFYRGFCEGPEPMLERTSRGWRMSRRFDIRDYVSPEWDESWQPNIYTKARWAKVQPSMRRYCALLDDPGVRRRREAYAQRDRVTPTETLIRRMVAARELEDPERFSIDAVCGAGIPGLSAAKGPAAQVD